MKNGCIKNIGGIKEPTVCVGRFSYGFDICMGILVVSTIKLKCIMLFIFAIYVTCIVVGVRHVCFGTTKK